MTRVALITGANRGLGLETARQLGRTGVTTIIAARDPAKGAQAAAELRTEGIEAVSVALDVTSLASVRAAASQVADEYGRLDILVNNAGILPEATAGETPGHLDLDLFRQTFDTNVFGAVAAIQEFLPLLRESDSGRIVNVSTTMGSLSDASDPESPYYGVVVPAYQASKAAVNAITVALAKLLHDSPIKVNSICPGWVQTDLGGPNNRAAAPLTAEEAAPIVVEMASIPDDGPSGQFVDRDGPVAW
jgi:NAD(P)-dependent dehydrogenase (short-subunit alcohol dehydrogenase family)